MSAPTKPVPSGVAPAGEPAKLPTPPIPLTPPTPDLTKGAGVPAEELARMTRLIEAQGNVIRESQQATSALMREVQELREKRDAAPPVPPAEQDKAFWASPSASVRKMIAEEVGAAVAPIRDAVSKTSARSAADEAKDRLAKEYGNDWPSMEPFVNDFINRASSQGVALDSGLYDVAGLTAFGALQKGQLTRVEVRGAPTPVAPTPAPTPVATVPDPAHMRPSAPVIPGHEPDKGEKTLRQLTENEERLRREKGQTHEQYLAWIEEKPENVVRSQIGKEPAK